MSAYRTLGKVRMAVPKSRALSGWLWPVCGAKPLQYQREHVSYLSALCAGAPDRNVALRACGAELIQKGGNPYGRIFSCS
jgi:hypothetical protein